MSSKVTFRARTVDSARALPIYRAEEVPELVGARSQAGPAYTGMEREEEGEKHLQVSLRSAGD